MAHFMQASLTIGLDNEERSALATLLASIERIQSEMLVLPSNYYEAILRVRKDVYGY